jgi:hypothetical protein
MDPAIEVSTLVSSYVWALHDLIPEIEVVAEFQPHLERLDERFRGDFACVAQLYEIASRTPREAWPPHRGPVKVVEGDLGEDLLRTMTGSRQKARTPTAGNRLKRFKGDIRQWVDDFKAAPSPDDYDAFLRRHLGQFKAHASFIVSPAVCGTLILTAPAASGGASDAGFRRVLTQDRFAALTARLLLERRMLAEVVTRLDYCPLVLRELCRVDEKISDDSILQLLSDEQYPRSLITRCNQAHVAVPFSLAHHDELDEIDRQRHARSAPPAPPSPPPGSVPGPAAGPPRMATDRAWSRDLIGLAISGGGIRSATFALGVLQGLATRGWLTRLDYLSTVSGGGYIGAWLLAWIKRRGSVRSVQESLRGLHAARTGAGNNSDLGADARDNPDPGSEHVRPIRLLREYSNYLSPKGGVFSTDTWTIGAIWIRNTLLNLVTLTLFLMAALLAPRVLGIIFVNTSLGFSVLAAFVGFWIAAALAGLNLQTFEDVLSIAEDSPWRFVYPRATPSERGDSSGLVLATIVIPMAVGGFCAVRASWLWWERYPESGTTVLITSFLLLWVGLMITAVVSQTFVHPRGVRDIAHGQKSVLLRGLQQSFVSSVCGFVAALAGAATVKELWEHLLPAMFEDSHRGTWLVVAFGPITVVLIVSFVIILYLGLLGLAAPDERREWWSRLGAWLGICALGWGAMTVITYFSPYLLASGGVYLASVGVGWTTLTGVGAWLAASGKSNGVNLAFDKNVFTSSAIRLSPYLFIAGFLIGVTVLTQAVEYWLRVHPLSPSVPIPPFSLLRFTETYWSNMRPEDLRAPLLAMVMLGAALLLAWRVDVNEFSMHHFYKNRLVRAYLGASRSRSHRRPNAFTGLDMDDDIKLWRFKSSDIPTAGDMSSDCRSGFDGPFAIVNTTLNLTTGDELAYRERKGQSFVFTPLYCGFDFATKQTTVSENVLAQYAMRPTDLFGYSSGAWAGSVESSWTGTGLGIGTTIAISGAAANPNAGYHSSPAVAFLLTLFNARLGWWIGNPLRESWRSASPGLGLPYLLSELFGFSNQRRNYVNLSDGGHFDNMGLYELVRRRCRYIIVCDGEQDDRYSFNGLAGAIRKCRIDFGVVIDIDVEPIRPSSRKNYSKRHAAVGTIRYPSNELVGFEPGVDHLGVLVYLKASMTGNEPTDIEEYHSRHREFPHQTTADQFFNESQFESYRALGQHVAGSAFADWPEPTAAGQFPTSIMFERSRAKIEPSANRQGE